MHHFRPPHQLLTTTCAAGRQTDRTSVSVGTQTDFMRILRSAATQPSSSRLTSHVRSKGMNIIWSSTRVIKSSELCVYRKTYNWNYFSHVSNQAHRFHSSLCTKDCSFSINWNSMQEYEFLFLYLALEHVTLAHWLIQQKLPVAKLMFLSIFDVFCLLKEILLKSMLLIDDTFSCCHSSGFTWLPCISMRTLHEDKSQQDSVPKSKRGNNTDSTFS